MLVVSFARKQYDLPLKKKLEKDRTKSESVGKKLKDQRHHTFFSSAVRSSPGFLELLGTGVTGKPDLRRMRFGGKMGCDDWDWSDISRFSAGIVVFINMKLRVNY